MRDLVEFKDFNFKYKSQQDPTLYNINFKIKEGEKIVIIGPSGSGKSTIAKAINSQIPNTFGGDIDGLCHVCGKDVKYSSIFDISLDVGTVLQDTDGQFVGLTVMEDIAFSLENDNVSKDLMIDSVKKWADILDITKILGNKPNEISGGQKQRVSLAGVLVSNTPILLLDEPLANLDPASGEATMRLVDDLNQQYGYSVIVIEHRLEEALAMNPDRIIVVDEGRIIVDDSPTEILKSDILDKIGVRKPLYIKALNYAGVDLSNFEKISSFDNTKFETSDLEKVKAWADDLTLDKKTNTDQPLLEVKNVSFGYQKDRRTLEDISFTINKGDIVSIVGPNGAGKSTLAKLLCGFIRPDSGEIRLSSTNLDSLSIKEIADHIGYVLQNPNAMISKTLIKEEVGFGLKLRGFSDEEINREVDKVLEICGLYPFRNWPISALSYGQKRRVTIASILVLNPEVIILDEPTAGQDYRHYTEIMEFIKELNEKLGLTILMISHDMHLIQEYTDRTLVIADGRMISDTRPEVLFANSNLLEKASLTETSLYKLAKAIDYDPEDFIEKFIRFERLGHE